MAKKPRLAHARETKPKPQKQEFTTLAQAHAGPDAVYTGERDDWLIVLSRNRDSSVLENSNFHVALEQLGGEGPTVAVERSGHFAVGWVEYLIVKPTARKRLTTAREIRAYVENFSVLDKEDFSDREHEAFLAAWESWGRNQYRTALAKEALTEFEELGGIGYSEQSGQVFYPAVELHDGILELSDQQLDDLERDTAVDWLYRAEGNGVTVNIEGLAEKTRLYDAAYQVHQNLRRAQYLQEIQTLGAVLGAAERHVQEAIQRGITLVSEFRSLIAQEGCL